MNRHDLDDTDSSELLDRYETIRREVAAIPSEDIAHRLPNLAETVANVSEEADDTVRFHVGVSFTKAHAPLDYWLDRIVDDDDGVHVHSLKPAVSREHFYLRFPYPPDPDFDACTLRGALLAAVERELDDLATAGANGEVPPGSFAAFWDHLRR